MKQLLKLTFLLLALLLPATAFAHAFEVDGIYYNVNGTNAIVTGSPYPKKYSGEISIPSSTTYNGTTYSVTSIGDDAFWFCDGMTKVTIPNSVTSIGGSAFRGCSGLSSISIPNSVTNIGSYAFSECSKLIVIYIGNSVSEIGSEMFSYCTSLTNLTIPNTITSIGINAFRGCSNLENVFIPNSVTTIGRSAFEGCTCLNNINVPTSVINIGEDAFSGTTWYDNQPNGLVYAGSVAYKYKGAMPSGTSISLKDGTVSISNSAFYSCRGLIGISFPNSLTTIGYEAFHGCSGLTNISIPSSVTNINRWAFSFCYNLSSIIVSSDNKYFDSRNNCNAIIESSNDELIVGCKNTIIPNSIVSIGIGAFCGCYYLNSIIIPNSVTQIGGQSFSYCYSLTNLSIPSSVAYIGDLAFRGCTSLTDLYVPNSISNIGANAFDNTAWYNNQTDGLVYAGLVAYKYKGEMTSGTSITIRNGTIGIAGDAFSGCNGLKEIIIPNSVTIIGNGAFSGCSGLTTIDIPNSVTSIGSNAFIYCSGLTSVSIPSSVNTIGGCVFSDCTSLTSVVLPNTITSIVGGMFQKCENLVSVVIPNSVTSIETCAFNDCYSLTSINIPFSVNSIEESAFLNCTLLNNVYSHIDPSIIMMSNRVFDRNNKNYESRTLFVPYRMTNAYLSDSRWSNYFGTIVEMDPIVASSIELDESSAFMMPGEQLQLTAELQPIEAMYNEVLWGSSNPDVATVSDDGLVTAVNVGTATITAMTTEGSNLSASCIVTVYTEMMGDVDGNGAINISDVTSLIDYLLNGDSSAIVLINADCDGSGVVNISDVTTLIDYLLSGSWPVEPEPGPVITPYTVNGVTFNMVEVEGGTFMMGATPEQGDEVWDREKPVHEVTLSGFNIGQTEVTQELWQAVMGDNPSDHTGDLQRPVDQVSWVDCIEFISKLNELTGKSFRLPTEAEWEYAARGGSKSEGYRYAGGNDMDVVSWYIDNSDNTTHPVATKAPNELGLYDMTGNVWEWCNDWYHRYTADAQVDPMGQATGTNRVLRGGCWNGGANYNRIAFRDNFTPTGGNNSGGMRLVLDADNSPKFRLSETVMKVDMGGNKSVNILNGGGSYTVSGGADFVTASISGNQLTVTGIATGTTTVHVTDAATGATAVIAVIVTENHDEVFTVNGVTFKMVTVDEGIFTMGATAEQGSDYNSNERPTHQVALSGYKIGQTEVTQELWVAVMGSNPSNFTGNLQRPVDKVSYNDCQEFISKLNQLTGKSFRLPTEAEWEFAARGGNLSQGYKYAGSNTVDDVAWYLDNSESTTHPVGTKAPNELGLYDMSGNVFEWCQDWYGAYSAETQVNPTGPTSGTYRVCRGGAWNYNSSYSRVSYRSYHSMTSRYDRIGLRLALD